MNQSDWNLPALIDHTILRPEATKADVLRLCREARQHGFTVIFHSALLYGMTRSRPSPDQPCGWASP